MKGVDYDMYPISQSPIQLGLVLCTIAFLTHLLARLLSDRRRNPSRLPLPPGPKGYPVIGNILDLPTSHQWRTYAEWAKVYGEAQIHLHKMLNAIR